ncbi:MAG: TIGR03013 family PEP-CTERM/XrtA system glycosyltransferase [Desulfobacteraceae bacterium]|nr:TIGR03013 family PEP-CTERM/XrtA system glycosyltransferase [Desulfobacteraceae bacterium]
MFSFRTTLGCFTIIVGDVIACFLIFWYILPYMPGYQYIAGPGILYTRFTSSLFTIIVFLSLSCLHFYSFIEFTYPFDLLKRIIPAFLLSFGFIASIGYFMESLFVLNWLFIPPLCAVYFFVLVSRFILFFNVKKNRERILLLGANRQARMIIDEANRNRFKGYEVVGVITSRDMNGDDSTDIQDVPILSQMESFEETMRIHAVDTIVITKRDRRGNMPTEELLKCKVKKIRIHEGFSFYEKVNRNIYIDEFLRTSWFIFEDGFFHTSLHGSVKRLQGIIISFILLTMLSPLLILIAILIKLESPGPVFYIQERVGRNGKPFKLIKFRSMAEDPNRPPEFFPDPNYVTRVGKFIRKIRLDEVPQLINIFKGDMDMVGPRPEQPKFVEKLEKIVPYYNLRHTVRPGLTGWAQVNFHRGETLEDSREKLKYDLYYVKHFSWYLDLLIMLLTIREVLFSKGH